MPDLKPCPFCGGEAYLEKSHRAFIAGATSKVSFVRCKKCNARSGRFEISSFGHSSYSARSEQKAIEAWNRRVQDGSD